MHRFHRRRPPFEGLLSTLALLVIGLDTGGCLQETSEPGVDPPLLLREETSSVLEVSLGQSTTCATTSMGRAKCWGRADQGRLGLGWASAAYQADPRALDDLHLGGGSVSIVTNGAQSFSILDDGHIRAFGFNAAGELGLPHLQTIGDDETPADGVSLVPLDGPALQVVTGRGFACAVLDDGHAQCWGRGDQGQLGRSPEPGFHPPVEVPLDQPVVELAAGMAHVCARLLGGSIQCWGANDRGQLGRGSDPPGPEVQLPQVAVQLVAGEAHTCARLLDGEVHCWGSNDHGQLGHGHQQVIGDDETPAAAGSVPVGGVAVMLAAGSRHSCALLDAGLVRCWGANESGQLGLSTAQDIGDQPLPSTVEPVSFGGLEAHAIFGGPLAEHSCALLDGGILRCWGLNSHGQLGLGFVDPVDPVETPPGDLPDVLVIEDPDD